MSEKCQDFDADDKIDIEHDCEASDEDESDKSTGTKADDSNGELTGCENPALELEEKWFEQFQLYVDCFIKCN